MADTALVGALVVHEEHGPGIIRWRDGLVFGVWFKSLGHLSYCWAERLTIVGL